MMKWPTPMSFNSTDADLDTIIKNKSPDSAICNLQSEDSQPTCVMRLLAYVLHGGKSNIHSFARIFINKVFRRSRAARIYDIHRKTLQEKIKKFFFGYVIE